jgi:hypothetical protein
MVQWINVGMKMVRPHDFAENALCVDISFQVLNCSDGLGASAFLISNSRVVREFCKVWKVIRADI